MARTRISDEDDIFVKKKVRNYKTVNTSMNMREKRKES